MGIFQVFSLARDYASAKKFVESKRIDIGKAKKLIEKIKEFIELLYNYKDELQSFIKEAKEILRKLEAKEKEV